MNDLRADFSGLAEDEGPQDQDQRLEFCGSAGSAAAADAVKADTPGDGALQPWPEFLSP